MSKEKKERFNPARASWRKISNFFTPPKTTKRIPQLEFKWSEDTPVGGLLNSYTRTLRPVVDAQANLNRDRVEITRLEQEREIADNNIMMQHRVVVVTTAATLVALLSSCLAAWAAFHKDIPPAPIVNVMPAKQAPAPDVKVYISPQTEKTAQ